jgi:DNA-binding PadR family transcriptional regulator
MELEGWIRAEWGRTDNNRRARYYRLTRSGRRQLERETRRWESIAGAMATILEEA